MSDIQMHDPDNEDIEPCHRCEGTGHVPIFLGLNDFTDEPEFGDRDCPDCGGSGEQPDPIWVSEMRAQYGPGWNE
jgi:hypothetical protein